MKESLHWKFLSVTLVVAAVMLAACDFGGAEAPPALDLPTPQASTLTSRRTILLPVAMWSSRQPIRAA